MSLILKNCKILDQKDLVDIFVEDGKIKKIGEYVKADQEIDVQGKWVIPGMIDCHVHFREPGMEYKEDWLTGSKASVHGGITTVLDMPNVKPPTITLKNLEGKRNLAKKSLVNYGFHFGATNDNLEEIRRAKNKIASIKVFMGASTGNLLVTDEEKLRQIFQIAKEINKPVCVHAEDEECIQENIEKYKDKKDPFIHSKIRPRECAIKAVKKALDLTRKIKNRLYILHVSTKEEMELIKEAKDEGLEVYCETTPHHLFLDEEELKKQGNFVKMNPPLRTKEDIHTLWQAIKDGIVDTIGTDHAPHLKEEKETDYWNAPAGVSEEETVLPLFLDKINKNEIDLKRLVELTSENPARIFKIRNKGFIKEGFDADLTVLDLDLEKEVKNKDLYTKCGWSPFDGWRLCGWPCMTIIGGNIVWDGKKISENIKGKEAIYG